MKWLYSRLKHALSGLYYAVRFDKSFRLQVYLIIGLGVISRFVLHGLSTYEYTLLLLAGSLVIITELQNSALESALDRIHPELHDQIGRSKDMMAGSVLLAGSVLAIVFLLVVLGLY